MPTPGSSRLEYEFLDKIGDGAFGQVYRAKHKRSCQVVSDFTALSQVTEGKGISNVLLLLLSLLGCRQDSETSIN